MSDSDSVIMKLDEWLMKLGYTRQWTILRNRKKQKFQIDTD